MRCIQLDQGIKVTVARHMGRARRTLRENLRAVDVVFEVVDARIPFTGRNPQLERLLGGKPRVFVLNKSDLAPEEEVSRWLAHLRRGGLKAVALDAHTDARKGLVKNLLDLAGEAAGAAPAGRALRAMVLGLPNVGKSTLINLLAGRASARTGAKPGVTRGKQWVRAGDLELLDLPGILPPHARSREALAKLAITGTVGPEMFPDREAAENLIPYLRALLPRQIEITYGLDTEEGDPEEVLTKIGRRRGCVRTGGEIDIQRAAELLLKDYRQGKLGRAILDRLPPEGDPR